MTQAADSKYMCGWPLWARGRNSMGILMPSSPAPPSVSAHRLQAVAAPTPSETRVSMVEAPWRAARKAALWKGQAPHVTTGRASAATTHCQPVNWVAGTMDRTMTGTDRTRLTMRRRRRSAARTTCDAPMRGAVPSRLAAEPRLGPATEPGASWSLRSMAAAWSVPVAESEAGGSEAGAAAAPLTVTGSELVTVPV